MRIILTLTLLCTAILGFAQNASLQGQLQDPEGKAVMFANVALYDTSKKLVKVETTNEAGIFKLLNINAGEYYLVASYVGSSPFKKEGIRLSANQQLDLGVLSFKVESVELAEATVTASRAIVEIKSDRTVFNVSGTINSTGDDGLSLLRKAPGVLVDNNNNINVLGRSGVLVYIDGKRLPLSGDDLTNYLENLRADQIDHIDIISSPGAKYEAEGNAGIIDIRLKKDKSLGANGSLTTSYSQGRFGIGNVNGSFNFRNKKMNIFGTAGTGYGRAFNNMLFESYQNGLFMDEINNNRRNWNFYNYRFGTDFFISEKSTIGFLVSGGGNTSDEEGLNVIDISTIGAEAVDSTLIANSYENSNRTNQTYNINYRYDDRKKGRSLNVDLDYGNYDNISERNQPNRYYDPISGSLLTEVINEFYTPSFIDIYTASFDFENNLFGGKLGVGSKFSKVVSDNTFLFYDQLGDGFARNDTLSNVFKYDENVLAGYVNYNRPIGKKWNVTAGLRVEKTDATGDLQAFLPSLSEEPVVLDYLSWFPNAGVSWQISRKHMLSLNYGRRINRPDYNVLNPFNNQLSQLSYQKGNPFLRPEIVNNLELGYTLAYRYNFKLSYSKTSDQITRLISPDDNDPRAGFITWDNLAEQTVLSFNASLPLQITKKWNAFFNVTASQIDNQADYGGGAVVDVQAFTYNIYTQQTFDLPGGFKGEISGWYSGPGVWGGVFLYESSWSLNVGVQKKFFDDRLNVRISANDLFYETGWDGYSEFNGLRTSGSGRWDSRRVAISLNYSFGNENVQSRKRKTGLEEEAGRVGE